MAEESLLDGPLEPPGFDHVVLTVHDLDAAAAFYERIGFTLTPKAQHPFGTGNRLAQMQGSFIELLAVTKPEDVPEPGEGEFSFGAYNRDYLKSMADRPGGMAMLALTSPGWEIDRARFTAAGLDLPAPFGFGRTARQPDGTEVKLDFRLTFAPNPAMPRATFFTCDHRHPASVFWKPDYQAHANGALRLAEVFMVSEVPEMHADFLRRLFGAVVPINGGLCAGVSGGGFCILEPDAFVETYPGATPPQPQGEEALFAGFRVEVADLSAAQAAWSKDGLPFRRVGSHIHLAGDDAFGALIALSQG